MPTCPICTTPARRQVPGSPYHECGTCECWWQDPPPPKVFHGPAEPDLEGYSDADKQVNRDLAAHLFNTVMGGKPGLTLDIGAKIPFLASCFAEFGNRAHAIDAEAMPTNYHVRFAKFDFERDREDALLKCCSGAPFDLITLIHVFEHMYDPLAALRKLRSIIADDGRVFLRLPDHHVPGFERDLTPHHYSIHPYFHCFTSILQALCEVRDCFVVESTTRMVGSGQRDIVLRPL